MKIRMSQYWKGFAFGTLLLIISALGVYIGTIGGYDISLFCGIIFFVLFFSGAIGTAISSKNGETHMESTLLGTPFRVRDQEPTKPFVRGFMNALGYIPMCSFFLLIAFLISRMP